MSKTLIAVLIAAILWFIMFSPWTADYVNFWYTMAASGVILTVIALLWGDYQTNWTNRANQTHRTNWTNQALCGIAIAIVLWCVFWLGDKVSQLMFYFARPQVDLIYGMKGDEPVSIIAILLLFIIGPAEEIFWRGFVQRRFASKWGRWAGFACATACYTLVHIWSFNFMLIVAAAACGFCWGLLYCLRPKMLPALIISHALWDVAAFVLFPF